VKHLRPGRNVLAIRAENVKSDVSQNPAGLVAGMGVESQDGKRVEIKTEDAWRASNEEIAGWRDVAYDDSAWKRAKVVAKFGHAPWGKVATPGGGNEFMVPYATGVSRQIRVIYVPEPGNVKVNKLEPDVNYIAIHFDPVSGQRKPLGDVRPDPAGTWRCQTPDGVSHDWVLILQAMR
jgi:hypothetical protein